MKTTRVFISYTHRGEIDMKAATALIVELRRIGLDVWIDREHQPPYATREQQQAGPTPRNPLFQHLVSAISESCAVIYVISPSSFQSEYEPFEFDPRILYQEFKKNHPDTDLKDMPLYMALIEPLVAPPGTFILGLDSTWSGRVINLTGIGATPLSLPIALTTMIRDIAPDRLYPLNPMSEWAVRTALENSAKEAPGCPASVSATTWLRLQGYLGLGPLFPGSLPFDKPFHEDQLRYGMYRTGDAARIVVASNKTMTIPKEVSILLSLWTANIMLRSNSNRIFDDKDLAVEYSLPNCLSQALEQANEELTMAIRLQFAFGLLSSPKKIDKVLATTHLDECKGYFEKLGSNFLTALLDILYSQATDQQLSQDSIKTIKSIDVELYDADLRHLYHSLLDAAFPGPRLEATEGYRSTIMSFKDSVLKASAMLQGGFAKRGEEKFNPEYWERTEGLNEWSVKGSSLATSGRYDEAIECFDKALEINPDDAKIWYIRGLSFLRIKKYNEAIDSFDKALEINPDDTDSKEFRDLAQKNKSE